VSCYSSEPQFSGVVFCTLSMKGNATMTALEFFLSTYCINPAGWTSWLRTA
jgi:hypothetical protein